MYGTFVQSTYEDKGKEKEMFRLCSKSPLTSLLGQEKIDGMEKTFETKLDNKFNELLARFPPPPSAAPDAPLQ